MSPSLFSKFNQIIAPKSYITVVSGLPRSGTSMMMKMLEAGGIEPLTDQQRSADDDNPKGYYEFEQVKQLKNGDSEWIASAAGKAVKVISYLLEDLPSNYQYRVIFMQRNMDEILASQRKMLINRGEDTDRASDEAMAEMFGKHLLSVSNWLENQQNIQVLYLDYNQLIFDPTPYTEQINHFLDDNLGVENMLEVVDKNLYRNRQSAP